MTRYRLHIEGLKSPIEVEGIVASFVIARRSNEVVGVSARSQGEFNVQLIMEKMGGGGHLNNAAVQLTDVSVTQVAAQLKSIIQPAQPDSVPKE